MSIVYNLLLILLAPVWVPWMIWRTRKRKEQPNWQERFGNFPFQFSKDKPRVWIHAVSVGETVAVIPILKELRELRSDLQIVLSVTTSSGHEVAVAQAKDLVDHIVYFPIDVPRFMLAAMSRVRPQVVAIMETELWFNFLHFSRSFNAKTLLINGRISDRSFSRSMKLRFFYQAMFKNLSRSLMQTQTDAERISALGASNVEVFGNCKFDISPAAGKTREQWRSELNIPLGAQVVVIGSTRGEDEEQFVLVAAKTLPEVFFIHAPRHLERADVLTLSAKEQLGAVSRRSLGESGRYLILDTYGDLSDIYACADVAIVGGGFGNYGGQNLIQPLALGIATIHGPNMQNFRSAADEAHKAGATQICEGASLAKVLSELLADSATIEKMGAAGAKLVADSSGASRRYAEAILSVLP